MGNIQSIMSKLARNAEQLGLSVVSQSGSSVKIDNGSNDLTISYVSASIQSPQGGVDPSVSPYLGIGVANPGQLKLKSTAAGAMDISDVLDSVVAAQVLQMLSGMANDIVLENGDASFSASIRGSVDQLGMGQ